MKILMATSEFSPLGSTGDLGDQIRILAVELKRLGHDVSVVMPFYRSIREGTLRYQAYRSSNFRLISEERGRRLTSSKQPARNRFRYSWFVATNTLIEAVFMERDGRAYEDNAERFIFFSKATIELAQRLSPSPELIHCHDWTTALIPVFVRDRQLAFLTVLTIHNLEHQGSFWSFDFGLTGLPGSYFGPRGLEFYGRLNFLKGGILYADAVTLPGEVSLFEAFNPQHGFGLDAVLQENRFRMYGIPHGVDYSQTNPPSTNSLVNAKNPKRPTPNWLAAKRFSNSSSLNRTRTVSLLRCPSSPRMNWHSAP